MGDGKRLKEILDKQGMSVRKLAKETSISPTTLYSIIQKDTGIRYDFALRISNVLNIDVDDICSDAGLKKKIGIMKIKLFFLNCHKVLILYLMETELNDILSSRCIH